MDKAEIAHAIESVESVVKKTASPKGYPFITTNEFRTALRANPELAMLSFIMQYTLQEDYEKDSRETVEDNNRGFMSSHAKTATRIAEAIMLGGELEMPEGGFRADGMQFFDQISYANHVGARYAASTLRTVIGVLIANDEALAERAARFNVKK